MTVARRSATHYSAEGDTISRFGGGQNADSDHPIAECHESCADRSTNSGSIVEIKRKPSVRPLFQTRMSVLKKTSFIRFTILSHLSHPAHERVIYRMIRQLRATTIVEIGVQEGIGSQRIIEAALRFSPADEIWYTGIDLFEARPPQSPGLKLKEAHRRLKRHGVHVHLIPGDPFSALARSANTLTGIDLIVIRGDQATEALRRSWFYVPRMLHEQSVVLQESNSATAVHFTTLSHASIEQWARENTASRRAA